jgi:hypothetical protein
VLCCSCSLSLKKLANPKHAKGVASVFEAANLIISCVSDSARVRWLVNKCQEAKYGKVCVVYQQQQQQQQQHKSRGSSSSNNGAGESSSSNSGESSSSSSSSSGRSSSRSSGSCWGSAGFVSALPGLSLF